jgi:beta-mannosidase
MHKQVLHSGWTLKAVGDLSEVPEALRGKTIPANVPGCVHTALLAAELIDDPSIDRNELKVQWIGRTDWQYSAKITADAALLAHERVDLVCEGLDTIARVELNGALVFESASMHLPQRTDVKKHLRSGTNELAITFASALKYAETMEKKHGALPHVEKHPFNFIRKMACNFGWDWGPTLVTAGVWRGIRLECFDLTNELRIKHVRPHVVEANETRAIIDVYVDLDLTQVGERRNNFSVNANLEGPDGTKVYDSKPLSGVKGDTVKLRLIVDRPQLWWPRGHGKQPRYWMQIEATQTGSDLFNPQWEGFIGLRTVKLNTNKDEIGSKFQIEVNGKPIFCKGANWIPDDCFPHRVDEARYRKRIQQAADANMNMLRIWGGGIFETDTFYSICDEIGIMVWQDFLFACAAYPEEEPYKSLVEAEARHHVARLSSHPSLVLWNGCNENVWGYFDWGWKQKIGDRTWGLGYYTELLPKLVKEIDPE